MSGLTRSVWCPLGMIFPAIFARAFSLAEAGHARACALLLVIGLALFLPGRATLQPMDRDEPRFAQATKQMLETGDFVDIRLQEEARHKKPVGIYWMQAAAVAAAEAVGVADAMRRIEIYRIPSLLGALATVLFTYAAATAFLSGRGAFLAAVLVASTILLGVEARLAKTDAVLTATVAGAMAVIAHAWHRRDRATPLSIHAVAGFWLAVGIGILVKGPITPMIVAVAVGLLAWRTGSAAWLKTLRPWAGLLLVAFMVLPWFVAITIKSGGSFFEASLGEDMLAKVAQGKERHGAPPGTYLAAFLGTAWPMVPFVLLALPRVWAERKRPDIVFCAVWAVPMWVVLELVPTKLPHYVLPLYPALAILAAAAAERGRSIDQGGWPAAAAWWITIVPLVLLAGLVFGSRHLGDPLPWIGLPLVALAAIPALFATRELKGLRVGSAALAAAFSACILSAGVYGFSSPVLRSLRISERLADAGRAACEAPAMASTGYSEPSLVFLTSTEILLAGPQDVASFLARPGCRVAFVESRQSQAFEKAVSAAGIELRLVTRVSGFNINGGRRLEFGVWARENGK
jgi:4-amino-4-deoxy-L-arabinose transferase-like glycosyltransferase